MRDPEDPQQPLSSEQIRTAGLSGWVHLPQKLRAIFSTTDFAGALELTDRIGAAAEVANHHPELLLSYRRVAVTLTSHDVGDVTGRDVELARTIGDLAASSGATADPAQVTELTLCLDTHNPVQVHRFLVALLGSSADDEELIDPLGSYPDIWFQQAEAHLPGHQRWHPDVWVDRATAEVRLEAVLQAGGTLVDDSHAPSYWVVQDPQGNRACICTTAES